MRPTCTICNGTKFYVNSRFIQSDVPCNECDPEGWEKYLIEHKIRKRS